MLWDVMREDAQPHGVKRDVVNAAPVVLGHGIFSYEDPTSLFPDSVHRHIVQQRCQGPPPPCLTCITKVASVTTGFVAHDLRVGVAMTFRSRVVACLAMPKPAKTTWHETCPMPKVLGSPCSGLHPPRQTGGACQVGVCRSFARLAKRCSVYLRTVRGEPLGAEGMPSCRLEGSLHIIAPHIGFCAKPWSRYPPNPSRSACS